MSIETILEGMGIEITLESIPNIVWPSQSGKYNVVQFCIGKTPYLRFGKEFCSDIVKKFAAEIGVEILWHSSMGVPLDFTPKEKSFEICGAGKCDLDLRKNHAYFYGENEYYSKRIDLEHLRDIQKFSKGIQILC